MCKARFGPATFLGAAAAPPPHTTAPPGAAADTSSDTFSAADPTTPTASTEPLIQPGLEPLSVATPSITFGTTLRSKVPLNLGQPPEKVATVVHNRDGSFELLVHQTGVISFAMSDSSSWVPLTAHAQRMVHDGALLEVGETRYRVVGCPRPRAPKRPAPCQPQPDSQRQRYVDDYVAGVLQTAKAEQQLLSGLQGAELRSGARNLAAVREAATSVALAPTDPRAMQQAAGKIKKVVNDHNKRQRREENVLEHATDRAKRIKRAKDALREAGTSKRERKAASGAADTAKRQATRIDDRRTLFHKPHQDPRSQADYLGIARTRKGRQGTRRKGRQGGQRQRSRGWSTDPHNGWTRRARQQQR